MYCIQCASPLDAAAQFCAKCGKPVSSVVRPSVSAIGRPPIVRTAVWMLAITTGLSLLLTVSGYARAGFSTMLQFAPFAIVSAVFFLGAWIAVITMLSQGQSVSRFLAAGLLIWTAGNLLVAFSRIPWAGLMQGTMIWTWIIFGTRAVAVGLLFTAESNSWFSSVRR